MNEVEQLVQMLLELLPEAKTQQDLREYITSDSTNDVAITKKDGVISIEMEEDVYVSIRDDFSLHNIESCIEYSVDRKDIYIWSILSLGDMYYSMDKKICTEFGFADMTYNEHLICATVDISREDPRNL